MLRPCCLALLIPLALAIACSSSEAPTSLGSAGHSNCDEYEPPTLLGGDYVVHMSMSGFGQDCPGPIVDGCFDCCDHHVATDRYGIFGFPELVVLLPDRGKGTSDYSRLLGVAESAGYRSLGLMYQNKDDAASVCPLGDDVCIAAYHEAVIYGGALSPLAVTETNSIVGGLTAVLGSLAESYPEEEWSSYLSPVDGQPAWENIVLVGVGDGGAHAAFIGKDHSLAGLVLIGAAGELIAGGDGLRPAAWCEEERATDASRTYGLLHKRGSWETQRRVLAAFGLPAFGEFVDVTESKPPHGCTHQLLSDLEPLEGTDFDGSLAEDATMPRGTNGQSLVLFWDYIYLFAPNTR